MRRTILGPLVGVLVLCASPALADTQPSNGVTSTGRNEAGFGGGPHCHVIAVDSAQSQVDFIVVYPSHTGHTNAGNDIFNADPNCDGDPGI
jgi:hypothetical protein